MLWVNRVDGEGLTECCACCGVEEGLSGNNDEGKMLCDPCFFEWMNTETFLLDENN